MRKPIVASYCTTFLKPEMLHIYRQVTALERYETFVICKERQNADRFPFHDVEILRKPPSNFIRRFYLKYIRREEPFVYRGEMKLMTEVMQRRQPDLMHIYFGHTGVHLLPFIKRWDRPCVVSFHGADVMLRPRQPDYEQKLTELCANVALVLVRSQSLRERLTELGCPEEKLLLNRAGIPLEAFALQERRAPENGEWRFVQACRLIPKKGIFTALRAFARFRERFPRARFIIAGDGPLKAELRAAISEMRIEDAVELKNFLPQRELRELFYCSHVFVHPSETTAERDQEGVPNSMLEAMATGLPVLATRHGGIPDAVMHGKNGLLVPEKNPAALFEAMLEITSAPEMLSTMGGAAAEFVRANFSQKEQIARLEKAYDRARTHFAYLFERYPSFTRTFCVREVEGMAEVGLQPLIFSLRRPQDVHSMEMSSRLSPATHYVPPLEELTAEVALRRHDLSRALVRALDESKTDYRRLYEAAYIAPHLAREKIRHVHAHFAGMAARTAFWLKKFYGITYSFTGHANDIFCEKDHPVTLEDLMREAEFVVTVSDFSRRWLQEKFPQHSSKIFRVYNGLPVEEFAQSDLAGNRIVAVGRYVEKKGFGDLIDACGILKNRGVDFRCEIVGDGPLQETWAQRIRDSQLADQVVLTGPKSPTEVRQLLSLASVFVLPCVREVEGGMDNLPTVIMEAMASGVPVISTAIAGVPEMAIDGESGFLVPEKDPQQLAEAIKKVLGDGELRLRMGQRARALAAERFSIEKSARDLRELLAQV